MEKKNEQTGVIHVEMSPFQGFKTLYAQGYSLVPLSPGSKKPMVKWKEYQERQPAPDKMREIMDGIRDCNWALLTGEQPSSSLDTATGIGVVILDADDLDAIELVESRCPATPLQVTTPSSGRHFYYRHPGTQVKCRQKTCIDGRKYNLDLKADGGYCVAPGGRRADGKGYVPNLPPTPELIESLPVYDPNWIVCESAPQRHDDRSHSKFEIGDDAYHEEAIEFVPVEMDERIAQAKAWMSRQPGATQGQGSGADCYCFALAVKLLWGFAIPADEAFEMLYEWGEGSDNVDSQGGYYPWSASEIGHKISSAVVASYDGTVGDQLDRSTLEYLNAESVYENTDGVIGYLETPSLHLADAQSADEMTAVVGANYLADSLSEFPDPWTTTCTPTVSAKGKERKRRTFKLGERLDMVRPEWLVRGLLRKNTTAVLFGESGSRKTWLTIDLALSIATGRDFLDSFPVKHGKVFYVISEGADDFEYRCLAWCKQRGIGHTEIRDDDYFVYCPSSYDFTDEDAIEEFMSDLEERLGKADTIIIDTLSKNFSGDADKNAEMNAFLKRIELLRERTGATVILIHHTGWQNTTRERGGRSLRDNVDTSIAVCKKDDLSVVSCAKQKMGREFETFTVKFDHIWLNGIEYDDETASGLVGRIVDAEIADSLDDTIYKVIEQAGTITQGDIIKGVRSLLGEEAPGDIKVKDALEGLLGSRVHRESRGGAYLHSIIGV